MKRAKPHASVTNGKMRSFHYGDELHSNCYKYYTFSSPMPGVKNCICVIETDLLLPIGLAEAI